MTALHIALAGAAHIHTPGFIKRLLARTDVRVTHVWDHDEARRGARAHELGATACATVEEIAADAGIAAVIVCSETNLHKSLVLPLVEARKAVFVEKPLGFASADAREMARAIDQADVLFSTGYFQRGDPINQFIKQQIAQGGFGRVTRVRKSNAHSGSLGGWFDTDWRWMADPLQAGVGAFGDLGTHALDIVMDWLGMPVEATAATGVAAARYGADCDEFGEGLLRFADGTTASVAASWVDVADPVTTQVCGTEGHAVVVNGSLYFQSRHVAGADGKQAWTDLPAAWPHAFENFLDALVGKPHPALVTAAEAAGRNTVMEAMMRGAAERRWIQVSAG
jgi:predicted dehydrogenase